MNLDRSQDSRREPRADAKAVARRDADRSAVSAAPARALDPGRESIRIVLVLAAVIGLAAAILNVAVLHASRSRVLEERWNALGDYADDRRTDIRAALTQYVHQGRYLASQAELTEWVQAGAARQSDRRLAADRTLGRAVEEFRYRSIQIVSPSGAVLASTSSETTTDIVRAPALVREAVTSGRPCLTLDVIPGEHVPAAILATPLARSAGVNTSPAVVIVAPLAEVLRNALTPRPSRGMRTTSYLIRQVGSEILVLTAPPARTGLTPGDRVALSTPRLEAAALAARNEESAAEIADPEAGPQWTVTRYLPEVGVGLVTQTSRPGPFAGMAHTLSSLLLLDGGIALLSGPILIIGRRRYLGGLARRGHELGQRQADRLQEVIDHAFDAILSFDEDGRVRTANHAAERLFKRSGSQILGEPVTRFLRCGVPGRQGDAGSLTLDTVTCSDALRSDGVVVPVEYSLTCAGEVGERLFTAVVRDIGDRVQAQERIRSFAEGLEVTNRQLEEANAQLEEASRLKSEFLANTSHELRTPLNGMIGFLQLVLDGMCDSREEERDFLGQALQCSRHLLGLINDVLDIAKIEAGKLTLEIEAVDVRALFGEIYTLTHVQAAQKGLALKFVTADESMRRVRGDFSKIKQVLINLVGNSLKFTSHGSITVQATEHPDLGYVLFEVIDTGIGISPERQRLVFEKFIQGDGSSTRKYGGTGLGLAISRSLVEMMGGIIDVESEGPGAGTRISFSLPIWRSPEEEEEEQEDGRPADQIEGPPGGQLILVVEDDAVFRKFLTTLLHRYGYRTVEADDAELGWMLARRLRPALVVLDYALSSSQAANLRTGWDLAERMTTDPRTRHLPVIFVTGFDHQLRDKLKATVFARPPEHMMKPVDGSALLAKVEELVGARSGGVARVLMADDDPSVSAFVRKVLPEDRFHVEVANNGEECLHALRTQPRGFDLLLLDLMMPDVSGYDVLRELSLTASVSELPVLILTNFPEARTDDEKRLLEKGLVLDVIPKSSVHENPQLLSHIIDWHLQVAAELGYGAAGAEWEQAQQPKADETPEERAA